MVFVVLELTLFAIPPQGTKQFHDPLGNVIILADDFGEFKPRQICHISDENDVISFMQTSNGSFIECPINCEVAGNECVYPLSDEEIVRELRKGPQGLTQGEAAFVNKIVLSSTQVQEIIGESPYQTYCCGYEYNITQTHPRHYYLLASLNMKDKKEFVSVEVDLQTLQVTNVQTDVPWGGSGEPTALPPLKQFKSELYNQHELVLCGKVIAKNPDNSISMGGPSYTIKVEEYYKNPKPYHVITALGSEDNNGPRGMTPFEIGETGLFYMDTISGKYYIITPDSEEIQKCEPNVVLSPLKQIKYGITKENIQCNEGLALILKSKNDSPVCVKPSSASRLIELGWGHGILSTTNGVPEDLEDDLSDTHRPVFCPVDESLDPPLIRINQFGDSVSRLVFFVKSNSTAQICIKYTSGFDNHGSIPVANELIVDYHNQTSYASTEVTVSAEPSSVPLEMNSETFVLFTITAPNNSEGVYWLPEGQMCGAIPIIVWFGLPQVDSSELPVIMRPHGCPAIVLDAKIVGFSGAIMDYKPGNRIGGRN